MSTWKQRIPIGKATQNTNVAIRVPRGEGEFAALQAQVLEREADDPDTVALDWFAGLFKTKLQHPSELRPVLGGPLTGSDQGKS